MILMSSHNSDGSTGRCDAKCYNAVGPDCDCICGKRNHEVNIKKAIGNTRDIVNEMIDAYCEKKGIDRKDIFVSPKVNQLSIFD